MPVCRNTSRENGRSFVLSVAGRNTTSFAGNAKGAASRASVPPLSNAHTIYRKGEQDNDRLSEQHFRKAGNHQGKRDYPENPILSSGFHTNMIAIILDKPVVKPLNI